MEQERPYKHDSTASRPLSEVKHALAVLASTTVGDHVGIHSVVLLLSLFTFCFPTPQTFRSLSTSTICRKADDTHRSSYSTPPSSSFLVRSESILMIGLLGTRGFICLFGT